MSRDDFTIVKETEPNKFVVLNGSGDGKGREVYDAANLKDAILAARGMQCEYGPYFIFLEDAVNKFLEDAVR